MTTVASGLDKPLFLASPPGDPRLFVVEQTGRIQVLQDAGTTTFLDLSSLVSCCEERGLLGLAFAPDYAASGRLFVNYTDRDGDTVVAEYARSAEDPDRASPGAVRTLFTVEQPFPNHNGGMLAFGPDGLLYVGLGDGGAGGDPGETAEDPTDELGSLVRVDIDTYPEPPLGNFPGGDPDVFAIGLRNPWRFSFDRATGDLYVGDVGQDLFEEIDVTPAGATAVNYGWDVMEGFHCFEPRLGCRMDGLTLPAVEYGRDLGCSVTGGYVYRGDAIPTLRGRYLYGDYCSNRVWSMAWRDGEVVDHREITGEIDPEGLLDGLSSFGEDAAGELYLVSLDGSVFRVDPE